MDDNPSGRWYQELVIEFADGLKEAFFIERTRTGTHLPRKSRAPAPWTQLNFHKCQGCPLPESIPYCPAAQSLEETLDKLKGRISHEIVTATSIDRENRSSTVRWPLQDVGAVFVQLAVFSSGCPMGGEFKHMLQDLRPFSTSQELTKHLLEKFLLKHQGAIEDSREDILARLQSLGNVFLHLHKRLTQARLLPGDAVPNSIVTMHAFAAGMALKLERLLKEIANEMGWTDTESLGKAPANLFNLGDTPAR